MDKRLEQQKNYGRAMQSYVLMLHEFIWELRPKKILELGTQNGQSTKTILMAINEYKDGQLISIDHKRRHGILDLEYSDLKPYWFFIMGNTHDKESLEQAKSKLIEDELYDVLFIDAGHKYDDIVKDWNDYTPLVKPGGLIFLHDTINQNEGVKDFWKEITWEKFNIDWGRARNSVIPGFGIVRKPL